MNLRNIGVVLLLCSVPVWAQPAAPASGFRAEVLADMESLGKKLVSLAQAVPAEKYSWRPAAGVRSISEVYIHVAGGNYFIPAAIGTKPPAGVERGMEKTITEKAKVVETLRQSLDHVRQVLAVPDADLDKSIKLFGSPSTTRAAISLLANHLHEHLGQSIAYARVNGVVPPWSAGRE